MLLDKPFNQKVDIYSFGITLWELLVGEEPYNQSGFQSLDELIQAVCMEGERPPLPSTCPPVLKDLIVSCWDGNPDNRPSFGKMLQDKIFSKLAIDSVISDKGGAEFWKKYFLDKV